jgi:hypothetical protein
MPGPLHRDFPENLGAVWRRNQDNRVNRPNPADHLVDNLNASKDTKDALKRYYRRQADLTAMSTVAANYHHKIKELERLVAHPDPQIRRRAEYELQEAMDMIKVDMHRARSSNSSLSLSDPSIIGGYDEVNLKEELGSFHSENNLISDTESDRSIRIIEPEEGDQLFDMPDLEYATDNESLVGIIPIPRDDDIAPLDSISSLSLSNEESSGRMSPQPQDINIRMPNVHIDIRTPAPRTPVTRSQTLAARTPEVRPQAEAVHTPDARPQAVHTPVTRSKTTAALSPVAGPSRMAPTPTAPNRDRLWRRVDDNVRANVDIVPLDLQERLRRSISPIEGAQRPDPRERRQCTTSTPKGLSPSEQAEFDLRQRDLGIWLDSLSPVANMSRPEPVVTRSGRVSRPPERYSNDLEERRQTLLREHAEGIEYSKQQAKIARSTKSSKRKSEPVASASSKPPSGAAKKAPSTVRTRISKLDLVSQKSKSSKK